MEWYIIVLRLVLAVVLSGIIGFERELHGHPAGLRTHVLVAVGAALVMLISVDGFGGTGDPARLAAQVVSGIGFLGAGAIIRDGGDIRGITTATTLWIGGMIGLACGNGYYIGAVVATVLVSIFILVLRPLERKINNKTKSIVLTIDSDKAVLAKIVKIFDNEGVTIGNISADYYERNNKKLLKIKIEMANSIRVSDTKNLIVKISDEINPLTIVSR